MSQKQNTDFTSMSTGSGNSLHSRNDDTVIQPLKATGDVKPEETKGLAKASPSFKKIEVVETPKTKEEEKKVIAQNIIKEEAKKLVPEIEDLND